METAILQDLGLTNAEIKIYIALLELGVATAGPIIDRTRLQNSVVHMTLHKLGDKGFVTFVKKGKIKHFSWITNIELTQNNFLLVMKGGRVRWKVENETFNTLKNQGYNFEHKWSR